MDERLSNLESRVEQLARQLSDLERRMSRLDRGAPEQGLRKNTLL